MQFDVNYNLFEIKGTEKTANASNANKKNKKFLIAKLGSSLGARSTILPVEFPVKEKQNWEKV